MSEDAHCSSPPEETRFSGAHLPSMPAQTYMCTRDLPGHHPQHIFYACSGTAQSASSAVLPKARNRVE
jgi:hypothetical protein